MAKELASLGAAADSIGSAATGPAPTWSKVLGSLKLWGIAPASQSAAATPNRDQGLRAERYGPGSRSQSRRQLSLSDSDTELVEAESLSESEALGVPGGSRGGRALPAGAASTQQQDRLFSCLDSSQVSCGSNTPPAPPPLSTAMALLVVLVDVEQAMMG